MTTEDKAPYDMSIHCNPDAKAWAKFFMKTNKETGFTIDEELMHGWFANAMMAMHDHVHNSDEIQQLQSKVAEYMDENSKLRSKIAELEADGDLT